MAVEPDIERRLRNAADHWNLTIGLALAGGTRSAVFAVTDDHAQDLVLKLPATRTDAHDPAGVEAAALRTWAHTGAAIRLVDSTADALLLRRAHPGVLRPWSPQPPLDDTIDVAAELLARLWAASSGPHRFPTLAEVYPQNGRVAREDAAFEQHQRDEPDRGRPGLIRLRPAGTSAEQLIASTGRTRLLHGDFITKNIVSDASGAVGWVALDPLPMIGDPAAEVAAYAAYHPAGMILPITAGLARSLQLDVRRALRWAAIWAVHQAAQAWRDDQQEIEQLVKSREIDTLLT